MSVKSPLNHELDNNTRQKELDGDPKVVNVVKSATKTKTDTTLWPWVLLLPEQRSKILSEILKVFSIH